MTAHGTVQVSALVCISGPLRTLLVGFDVPSFQEQSHLKAGIRAALNTTFEHNIVVFHGENISSLLLLNFKPLKSIFPAGGTA